MEKCTNSNRQGSSLTVSSVKRIQGKAILTLSNNETLPMPRALLRERPYRSGMPFDKDAFRSLISERSYPFAMEKAVALLAARARTEKEIVDVLRTNAYPEKIIARVMQRLHEAGYVNDRDFADQWAAARTSKGFGTRRISMELRQKGVNPEEIDEILSHVDEDDLLEGAVKAALKAARSKNLSVPSDRQKIMAALARRGFGFDIARKALSRIQSEE